MSNQILVTLPGILNNIQSGNYEKAARSLFDKKIQLQFQFKPEFWYAQILVAALQNKGFHLAFLTAAYERRHTVNFEAMIKFFESYLDHPAYTCPDHQTSIKFLIKFYKSEMYKNPFRYMDLE